ncbi:MAG: penicillin acylase family protein, partial [Woeseiaceae bacterium]|nr:penicillin acylase family protein [Woeseiaceae bacterium]
FHMIHTTIPGELDVMGVSLLTGAFVIIGFNADVAWTHTISTAQRYTLYELELDPDDPMRYRYGDGYRSIEAATVTVGGEPRRVYFSHYGPLLANAGLPWTRETAYAVRLAAFAGDEAIASSLDTYEKLHRASSVGDVERAISLGGSWLTNTVAADRHGNAFYADISAAPNVDDGLLVRCRRAVPGLPPATVVLDGSRPDCEWQDDDRSVVPGNLPPAAMPRATSRDYFTNSNDSYWLSNPDTPLEGYPQIIGPERTARSLRTRAGLQYLGEVIADDGKVTPDELQQIIFSHRHFGAELLADDVLKLCADGPDTIADSCATLADWDRSARTDSRGTQLWTEFWEVARQLDGLYREPFDAERPVDTPRGLDVEDPAVRAGLVSALESAAERLAEASVPADAAWGQVQFADRNGERIPVPGARGWHGVFSYIDARLNPGVGYTPIRSGNSYIQVVSWTDDGALDARGILAYSQSPEPESPHYADQTRLYSRGEWIDLPFTAADISSDPNLRIVTIRE